jgi:hypothetical protein
MKAASFGSPHGAVPLGVTCRAKAKSTGKRCKLTAIPGGTVCRRHGGGAPQVRQAAARRLALSAAYVAAADLGLPVRDPTDGERAAARGYRQLRERPL